MSLTKGSMGKKTKIGKLRLDKYYELAKEQGYRSRSSFKLINILKYHNILSSCRYLLDLCAAPGGWLQVCQRNMPVESKIVGVDLNPIKSIKGVTTIQADIRSQHCLSLLKKEFMNVHLDVVLHDGSPNLGTEWSHDSYSQCTLVLSALKLATHFLRKGGIFITKVFRSQDYTSLLWTLNNFFDTVVTMKPISSRKMSAEIYCICKGYKKPDMIDPKFFNPIFVFSDTNQNKDTDVVEKKKRKPSLAFILKQRDRKNRNGYELGDDYKESSASSFFLNKDNSAEFLAKLNKLTFPTDDSYAQQIKADSLTTANILAYCDDLKVLGKREFNSIIKWKQTFLKTKKNKESLDSTENHEKPNVYFDKYNSDNTSKEFEWNKGLNDLLQTESQLLRRKKRKQIKTEKKKKMQEQLSLGINESHQDNVKQLNFNKFDENILHDLNYIREDQLIKPSYNDNEDEPHKENKKRKCRDVLLNAKSKHELQNFFLKKNKKSVNMELDVNYRTISQNEKPINFSNFETGFEIRNSQSSMPIPFNNSLCDIYGESIANHNVSRIFNDSLFDQTYLAAGNLLSSEDSNSRVPPQKKEKNNEATRNSNDCYTSNGASGKKKSNVNLINEENECIADDKQQEQSDNEKLSFIDSYQNKLKNKFTRSELLDNSLNRYTFGDDTNTLPSWFVEDEKRFNVPHNIIPRDLLPIYSQKVSDFRKYKCRKEMEAVMRKKMKIKKKLEKIKKQSECLAASLEYNEKSKDKHINRLYRKELKKNENNKIYVVANKRHGNMTSKKNKKFSQGKKCYVDRRLKKDTRRKQKRK